MSEIDPASGEVSMKPMLGQLVQEAVKLALIDCVLADAVDAAVGKDGDYGRWGETAERLRSEWRQDIYAMPSDLLARMDPMALAQNVACRLLGTGGWAVNGVYSGNATTREVMEATFERPDQSHVDELAFDLGLTPNDDDEDWAVTSADLNIRLPLTRVSPGIYEVPSVPGLGIVCTGQQSWACVRNGEPMVVAGLAEHPSLRFLHGLLADRVERWARKRRGR